MRSLRLYIASIVLVALTLAILPSPARAADDPALDYYTISTPNFYVHYYDGLEGLARRTAILAEESHQIIAPILDWQPARQTHILVTDKLDTANGFARTFGRNFITIYGMPPEADSVLGYYDDWLRILVYHEYVHILHLDTHLGATRWLNYLIGKQYHPNAVMPRWFIEGTATYFESARTASGRIKSPLFRMWLRTAALEDSLFTLGQSTGLPLQWPAGSAAYLYGGFFLDFVARKHSDNFFRDFNHEYGRRIIPFAMHRIVREITGQTLDELWDEFITEAQAEALAKKVAVDARGRTPLEILTDGGGRSRYPAIRQSPGDPPTWSITFHKADDYTHPSFAALSPSGHPLRNILGADGASGPVAWSKDGQTLYFSRRANTNNIYGYLDLFAYEPATKELTRLTVDDRAREPAISPDGTKLVHVRNRAGSMELVLRPLDNPGDATILLGARDYHPHDDAHWQQISRPTFTASGEAVVFSWWRLDKRQRDLYMVHLDTGEITQLTDGPSHDMDPHIGPDGLLYFAADVDGIFNIHAMDLDTEEVWQVTNVLNGVFSPALSPDGRYIYVHTYTHRGFELARLPHPHRFLHPDRRAEAGSLARINYPEPKPPELDNPRPYRPWPWLLPIQFTPDFGALTSGFGIAGTLSGYDPVEHHTYALSAGWTHSPDSLGPNLNVGLSYRYAGLPFNINTLFRVQDYPSAQTLIAESRYIPYTQRQILGRLGLSYPVHFLSHRISLSASFQVEHLGYGERPQITHEPGDIRPVEPQLGFFNQLSFGVNYSRLFRYPQSISTERGIAAGVNTSLQHPALGNIYNDLTVSYSFDAYHPNPLLKRHVLALRFRGAVTRRAEGGQRLFNIGGYAPQDVLMSLIFQEARRGFPLRGYAPAVMRGGQYQVLKLEYRFPILDLDRGFSTLPLFFRNLKGTVFSDTGTAYSGYLADAELMSSVGAEVQLDAVLGYYALNSLVLGYARGLHDEGLSEWYLFFGSSF